MTIWRNTNLYCFRVLKGRSFEVFGTAKHKDCQLGLHTLPLSIIGTAHQNWNQVPCSSGYWHLCKGKHAPSLQDCSIIRKSTKVTGTKQPKACLVPQISVHHNNIWCSCAIVLVSSYYLISYQYYTNVYLRNTSDKYAVIIWTIKACIVQNVFVTQNTHTCGDVVLMSYFNNGNNASEASMNNYKTMCWKQSGHMDMHFIYYVYIHTPSDQNFALNTVTLCFTVGRIRLQSWNNQLRTTALAQTTFLVV